MPQEWSNPCSEPGGAVCALSKTEPVMHDAQREVAIGWSSLCPRSWGSGADVGFEDRSGE
eukprot:577268-Amphidinium_carterae.1